MGFGFRISSFGFRVLGFGFQVSFFELGVWRGGWRVGLRGPDSGVYVLAAFVVPQADEVARGTRPQPLPSLQKHEESELNFSCFAGWDTFQATGQ